MQGELEEQSRETLRHCVLHDAGYIRRVMTWQGGQSSMMAVSGRRPMMYRRYE